MRPSPFDRAETLLHPVLEAIDDAAIRCEIRRALQNLVVIRYAVQRVNSP